jgi:membrane protease YdiL (CAAX protease family)
VDKRLALTGGSEGAEDWARSRKCGLMEQTGGSALRVTRSQGLGRVMPFEAGSVFVCFEALLSVVGMIALGSVVGHAILGVGDNVLRQPITWKTDAALAIEWLAGLIWLLLLVRRMAGDESWRRAFDRPSIGDIGWIAISLIAANLASLVVVVVQWRLFHLATQGWVPRLLAVSDTGPATTAFIALGIVLTPMVEEIAHRGILFTTLLARVGFWPAAVASSLVFALLHRDPGAIVPIFSTGLILAAVYAKTRSLTVPYAVHGAYNAGAFAWTMIQIHVRG